MFIRRELRVWDALDVEVHHIKQPCVTLINVRSQFLTTFTISLMKSLDIRSEPAVKLLAEFLDMDSDGMRTNAEQFAHGKYNPATPIIKILTKSLELYSYLRSPFRDLNVYDTVVQVGPNTNSPTISHDEPPTLVRQPKRPIASASTGAEPPLGNREPISSCEPFALTGPFAHTTSRRHATTYPDRLASCSGRLQITTA